MYLGGQAVGGATCDILFGKVNPSGKLAETFPFSEKDTPCYGNFGGEDDNIEYKEGSLVGYRYYEAKNIPVRYEFLIEPDSLPDDFDWQHARDVLDECLSVANPSMGDKLAKGIAGKSKLYFLQEETTLLYRDMMIFKGISSAQLKPVRIIDNVVKHNFFYTLIDSRFDMPTEKEEFVPRHIISE